MNRLLEQVTMPPRIARLPRNQVGYPIPWFVAVLEDGTRDFRIADQGKQIQATNEGLCWICGGRSGAYVSFTIGPMCAVNRISSEPPAHHDCAVYSAMVCPFLSNPAMRRRPVADSEGNVVPGGEMIARNPGVALVWTTKRWSAFRAPLGNDGVLYSIGDPTGVEWFTEGRPATRAEVVASIKAGLPALREACQRDEDPAASLRDVDRALAAAMPYLPAAQPSPTLVETSTV
jgi:hypothetical protein